MTSIQTYEEKSINLISRYINDDISERELLTMHHNLYYEIEEMHKQEIENAFQYGKWDWSEHINNGTESKDLAQYYQETFLSKGSSEVELP